MESVILHYALSENHRRVAPEIWSSPGLAQATEPENWWLITRIGAEMTPAYYMMAACLIGMAAPCFVIEAAGHSLRGSLTSGLRPKAG